MKYVVLAALISGTLHPAQAAEQCPLRVLGLGNAWIVAGDGETCEVKKVFTPNLPCKIKFDHDHGLHSFSCESGLSGHWSSGTFGSDAAGLSFIGADAPAKLPKHAEARKSWLAAIANEGLYQSYPIEMDEYYKFYPQKFTRISIVRKIENPDFSISLQSYQYTTRKAGTRVAVAGAAIRDCIALRFVSWVTPQEAETTERHLSDMLRDLRLKLTTETLPERRRAWVCKKPSER